MNFRELWGSHDGLYSVKKDAYLDIYGNWLLPFIGKPAVLVEFGILRGGSLQLFRKFLGADASIIGIDRVTHDNWKHLEGVAETIVGSQQDTALLDRLPDPDIVIDDAGHLSDDQIVTFDNLWPRMREGGLYFVEDLAPDNTEAVCNIIRTCGFKYPIYILGEILVLEKRLLISKKAKTGVR